MNNPWLGLSSYTEDSLKDHQFNGRSSAIVTLTTLIRQNLFVTLYGRSGIGKTSLLQAGVYPVLRREGFSPITIRLNNFKDKEDKESGDPKALYKEETAGYVVWRVIRQSLEQIGYTYRPCNTDDEYITDLTDVSVFRKLFSARRFMDKNGQEAAPVIVLDQFE